MTEPTQPPRWANSAQPGRTTSGHFTKGNQIGSRGGNPVARRMNELKRQIVEATTSEQVAKVMETLYSAAIDGDIPACTVWLKYVVGPPPQTVELTTGDDSVKVDVQSLTSVVLGALQGHPEARYAVAAALRENRLAQPEGADDGPGDTA
jgi:hypothetical protein